MSQVIKIKRSETASSVPSTGDLATHEIAMNVYDKKIFTKKSDGSIVTIAEANSEDAGITESEALALAIALG